MTQTETIAQALDQFIEEKESLAARERELLARLKTSLNQLGYELIHLETKNPPAEHKNGSEISLPPRRRGRPRKHPHTDEQIANGGSTTHTEPGAVQSNDIRTQS